MNRGPLLFEAENVTDLPHKRYLSCEWIILQTSIAFVLSFRAISFRALPPCIQNTDWYDKVPGTNQKVDQPYLLSGFARGSGVLHLHVMVWREQTLPLKQPPARLFVCLLLRSEKDDSPVAFGYSATLSPTMCHPVTVMEPFIFQVCFQVLVLESMSLYIYLFILYLLVTFHNMFHTKNVII